jgi:hypothetical protein
MQILQGTLIQNGYCRKGPEAIDMRFHRVRIRSRKRLETPKPLSQAGVSNLFSGFKENHSESGTEGGREALEIDRMPQTVDRRA